MDREMHGATEPVPVIMPIKSYDFGDSVAKQMTFNRQHPLILNIVYTVHTVHIYSTYIERDVLLVLVYSSWNYWRNFFVSSHCRNQELPGILPPGTIDLSNITYWLQFSH